MRTEHGWFFCLLLFVSLGPQTWPLQEVPRFSDLGNFRLLWDTTHVYIGKIRKQGRSRIHILLTKQHSRFPYTRGHCIVRKTGSCQPVRADSPMRGVHEGQLQDRLTEVSSGRTGQPRVESRQGRWSGNSATQNGGTLPDRGHLEPQSLSSHAAPPVGPSGRV